MIMWFQKQKPELRIEHELTDSESKIEVVAHKRATKQQITKVRKANDSLNQLLNENGFTLKIYLASGGKRD